MGETRTKETERFLCYRAFCGSGEEFAQVCKNISKPEMSDEILLKVNKNERIIR